MRRHAGVGVVYFGRAVFVPSPDSRLDMDYFIFQYLVFNGLFGVGLADFIGD